VRVAAPLPPTGYTLACALPAAHDDGLLAGAGMSFNVPIVHE